MQVIFWIFVFIAFYTYIGYGILLMFIIQLKKLLNKKETEKKASIFTPAVTIVIPAYNEQDFIESKIRNTLLLDYPEDKLKIVCIADGSDDKTVEIVSEFSNLALLFKPERAGKVAAMNRAMTTITSEITIFTDANTELPSNALMEITALFADEKVGCVAGEKRILNEKADKASTSGEGFYWKYESFLKKLDSEIGSTMGAAGELFAIRTKLYEEMNPDIILDDFVLSFRIAMKGYKIAYCPNAFAIESASANTKEEFKRKTRISAGGIQSIVLLAPLLNIFKYKMLSFQFISHRVLRWTLTPLSLLLILIINILILFSIHDYPNIYLVLLFLQLIFYFTAFVGWRLEDKKIQIKQLFIPYYFVMMNYATFIGIYRYLTGKQSSIWERAKRNL